LRDELQDRLHARFDCLLPEPLVFLQFRGRQRRVAQKLDRIDLHFMNQPVGLQIELLEQEIRVGPQAVNAVALREGGHESNKPHAVQEPVGQGRRAPHGR